MRAWVVLGLLIFSGGCATTRMGDTRSNSLFRQSKYLEASESLKERFKKHGEDGNDALLYYFDIGLSLHQAGKYEESSKYFQLADKKAEINDYTSLATEAGTLLVGDHIKVYKAEDFENVLINTYQALNYALDGKFEDSMVEVRRGNRKLYLMTTDGKRNYKQNTFARYLSGILYENLGEYDNAYIDYKEVFKLAPEFKQVRLDLWRMSRRLGRADDMERWEKEFSLSDSDKKNQTDSLKKSGKAEVIVIYQNGISPEKRPHPSFYQIPKFYPRYNPVASATVQLNGSDAGTTELLYNIEEVAIQNLDEKYAGIIAKKIAGVVAKEAVAHQISKQSPLLGLATKVAFYVADQADTRSWNLLPRDFQILRLIVPAGEHRILVRPQGVDGGKEFTVQVKAGERVFVNARYIP